MLGFSQPRGPGHTSFCPAQVPVLFVPSEGRGCRVVRTIRTTESPRPQHQPDVWTLSQHHGELPMWTRSCTSGWGGALPHPTPTRCGGDPLMVTMKRPSRTRCEGPLSAPWRAPPYGPGALVLSAPRRAPPMDQVCGCCQHHGELPGPHLRPPAHSPVRSISKWLPQPQSSHQMTVSLPHILTQPESTHRAAPRLLLTHRLDAQDHKCWLFCTTKFWP